MLGGKNHLDGSVVSNFGANVPRHLNIRETQGPRVRVVRRPNDLNERLQRDVHVEGTTIGPVSAQPQVYAEEGQGVALEPARLYRDWPSCYGPHSPVLS